VPAEGGPVESLTNQDGDPGNQGEFQVWPEEDLGVFTVWMTGNTRIEAMRLSTGERKVVTPGMKPYLTHTGHLVFASLAGEILAAPFDPEAMELTDAAVPLMNGIFVTNNAYPMFSLSQSGTLMYFAGDGVGGLSELVWINRDGAVTPVDPGYTFTLQTNFGLRLSPDGSRLAFSSDVEGNSDIRIKHLPDGPEERLTFSEVTDYRPVWAPDGETITYFSGATAEDRNVWSVRADGAAPPVLLLDDERSVNQGTWSPDGEWLVFRATATEAMGLGLRDVLAFRPGVDSAAIPLVASPEFAESAPALSPTGGWLAYSSNETGRDEVFVRPFPNVLDTRVRVSTDGGVGPVWSRDGREIFYLNADRELVSSAFDPTAGRVSGSEVLFSIPLSYPADPANNFFDVSLDGQRFLFTRPYQGEEEEGITPQYVLVKNWLEEVKARVPAPR
jgi:serine/threonine-protein kinase